MKKWQQNRKWNRKVQKILYSNDCDLKGYKNCCQKNEIKQLSKIDEFVQKMNFLVWESI